MLAGASSCAVEPSNRGQSSVAVTASPDLTTQRVSSTQAALDAVLAAARVGDRSAFDTHLARSDSTFADRLFANLTTMPSNGLDLRAQPRTAELAQSLRTMQPDGWAQQVAVTSRLEHDTGPASYEVWLVVVPSPSGVRLVGLADDPDGASPHRPLWMIQPVRLVTGPDATVLAAGDANLSGWLSRAEAAERAVRTRLGGDGEGRWKADLVVELPSSEPAFEQVLGVEPKSYHQIAAVAWPEGPDAATAAVRVVVNPAAAETLDTDQLGVLLTHEATHVVTRSASSPAPMWLVEGFADWVAFDRVPRAATPTQDLVLADVRRHGAPAEFPSDTEFRPDADDLGLAYGQAWLVCRFIAHSWSETQLVRLYAEIDDGTPLPAAVADVLGVDESTLLRRWRSWLVQTAGR